MCQLQRQGVRYDVLSLLVWSSAISALGFVLMSALRDPPEARWRWTDASLQGWLAVVYLGWGANVLAYWLWTSLLTRHPASRAAPFCLGLSVVGIVAGIVLLDERVTEWQWVGAALVMSALAFVISANRAR